MKRLAFVILAAVLVAALLGTAFAAAGETVEGDGYASPEEAVEDYLDGLKNMDLEQMMGTFAVETFIENYDFEGQLNRMKMYLPSMTVKLPDVNEFTTALNVESRRSEIANAILSQYVSLCMPGTSLGSSPALPLADEAEVNAFIGEFTANLEKPDFATLKFVAFLPPEAVDERYSDEANIDNIAKQAQIYGADKLESRVAVFELDGKEYMLCVDVADYGGKWRIAQLGGNIGNILGVDALSGGTAPID